VPGYNNSSIIKLLCQTMSSYARFQIFLVDLELETLPIFLKRAWFLSGGKLASITFFILVLSSMLVKNILSMCFETKSIDLKFQFLSISDVLSCRSFVF